MSMLPLNVTPWEKSTLVNLDDALEHKIQEFLSSSSNQHLTLDLQLQTKRQLNRQLLKQITLKTPNHYFHLHLKHQ